MEEVLSEFTLSNLVIFMEGVAVAQQKFLKLKSTLELKNVSRMTL